MLIKKIRKSRFIDLTSKIFKQIMLKYINKIHQFKNEKNINEIVILFFYYIKFFSTFINHERKLNKFI